MAPVAALAAQVMVQVMDTAITELVGTRNVSPEAGFVAAVGAG